MIEITQTVIYNIESNYYRRSKNMDSLKVFANRIKELRVNSKETQVEFAERIQVTPATVSAYENGRKNPSLTTLGTISQVYNISLDWLCGVSRETHNLGVGNSNKDDMEIIQVLKSVVNLIPFVIKYENETEWYNDNAISFVQWVFSDQNLVEFIDGVYKLTDIKKRGLLSEDLYQISINGLYSKYRHYVIDEYGNILPF